MPPNLAVEGTVATADVRGDTHVFRDVVTPKTEFKSGVTDMRTDGVFAVTTTTFKVPSTSSTVASTAVAGGVTVTGDTEVVDVVAAEQASRTLASNSLEAMDPESDTMVVDAAKTVLDGDVSVKGRIDVINADTVEVRDKILQLAAIDVNGDDVFDASDELRDASGIVVPGPPAGLPADVLTPELYEHSVKWKRRQGDFDVAGAATPPHTKPVWDFNGAVGIAGRDASDRGAKFVFAPHFTPETASLGMYYKVGDDATLVFSFETESFDWPGRPEWPPSVTPELPPLEAGDTVSYQFGSTTYSRSVMNRTTAGASNTDRFSVVSGALPGGLTLSDSGLLSGTLAGVDNFSFTVRAGCKYPSQYSDFVFSMDVVPPVSWVTAEGALPVAGKEYAEKGAVMTAVSLGATNAVSYEIVDGALNTGLSMSSAGTISGTPTTDGVATITVRAYSTNPKIFKVRTFTLQVGTTPVWSTPAGLTDVAKNGTLNQQLSAASALSYSVVGGEVPNGAAVSSSGLVTGPSLVAGSFAFTVRATGSAANVYADRQFTLLVATTPSWVTSGTMPNTSAQVAFSTVLSATNADATKYALQTGSLPGGCSLATNGTLSGTPSTAGSFSFAVRAVSTTSNLVYSDRIFTLVVAPLPVWSTAAALTDVAVGSPYSVQLSASNAVSYALKAGSSLPAGLSMSAGGLVTGTPSAAATTTFTVTVTGNAANATVDRTFTQLVATTPVWTTTGGALSLSKGVAYSLQLVAAGSTSFAVVAGGVPAGLALSASGLLSGTPTTDQVATFTVRATSSTSTLVFADLAFTATVKAAGFDGGSKSVAYADLWNTTARGQSVTQTLSTPVPAMNALHLAFSVYTHNTNNFSDNTTVDPVLWFDTGSGTSHRLRLYPNRMYLRNHANEGLQYAALESSTVLRDGAWSNISMDVCGMYVRFVVGGYAVQDWTYNPALTALIGDKVVSSLNLDGYDAQYQVRDVVVGNTMYPYPPVALPANHGSVQDSGDIAVNNAPYGNGAYRVRCSDAHWHASNAFTYTANWHGRDRTSITLGGVTHNNATWLRIDMPQSIVVSKYTVRGRTEYDGHRAQQWYLYGSNDDSTWALVHSTSDVNWNRYLPFDQFKNMGPTFVLSSNTSAYKYYTVVFMSSASDARVAGGVLFWGYEPSTLAGGGPREVTQTLMGSPQFPVRGGWHTKLLAPNRTLPLTDARVQRDAMTAPVSMYVNMSRDGGGHDFYLFAGNGAAVSYFNENHSGKALGLELIAQRTSECWRATNDFTLAKHGNRISSYVTATTVFKPSSGNNYTSYVMRAGSVPDWRVYDNGPWWLRDTTFGEPNGDYTGGSFLSVSFDANTDGTPTHFNDGNVTSTGTSYIVSTNSKYWTDAGFVDVTLPNGEIFLAYVRADKAVLVMNYNHKGGGNTVQQISDNRSPGECTRQLGPTQDEQGMTEVYGHCVPAVMNKLPINAVEFYGQTSAHGRVVHFKTSHAGTLSYFRTGSGSCAGLSGSFTPLGAHSANLPGSADSYFSNMGNSAMTNFPFYRGGTQHWAAGGEGSRWEVDDYNNNNNTRHQVWAHLDTSRIAELNNDVVNDMGSFAANTPTGSYKVRMGDGRVVTGVWDGTWMRLHSEANGRGSRSASMWSPQDMIDGSTHGRTSGALLSSITFTYPHKLPGNTVARYTCVYTARATWDGESASVSDGSASVNFNATHGVINSLSATAGSSGAVSGNTVSVDLRMGAKSFVTIAHSNGLNQDSGDESMLISNAALYIRRAS